MRVMKCIATAALLFLVACNPVDRRPGFWLTGDDAPYPSDWSFTDAHKEIVIEVATPYLIPHSVTIWCGSMNGELYVGARDPDSKNWPGWVDDEPNVRLGIDGNVYEVSLVPLDDPEQLKVLAPYYARKYQLPSQAPAGAPATRYWRVTTRT